MTPVCIITGFLGSGKTTLLNHVLAYHAFRNSLVIVNELGEVGFDHLLISSPLKNVYLLANGCLCCRVRGEMVETLIDLIRKRMSGDIPSFDRVFIETTGLADPVPILQMIGSDYDLRRFVYIDTIIGVVDAVHATSQLARHHEARQQVVVSDVLLLGKTDLASAMELADVESTIKRLNSGAELIRSPHGKVLPRLLFNGTDVAGRVSDLQRWLDRKPEVDQVVDDSRFADRHTPGIQSFVVSHAGGATRAGLAAWLSMLASFKGPQLLRVKGIVNVAGRPFVVHAVQSVIHDPVELEAWPDADQRTRVVFITQNVGREVIERSFEIFQMTDTFRDPREIDTKAYAQFCRAAMHLLS